MRIPSRHVTKPVEPPKEVATVERITEVKDNSEVIIEEVKRLLAKKREAPTYIFDIVRDENGSAIKIIATPFDSNTIV